MGVLDEKDLALQDKLGQGVKDLGGLGLGKEPDFSGVKPLAGLSAGAVSMAAKDLQTSLQAVTKEVLGSVSGSGAINPNRIESYPAARTGEFDRANGIYRGLGPAPAGVRVAGDAPPAGAVPAGAPPVAKSLPVNAPLPTPGSPLLPLSDTVLANRILRGSGDFIGGLNNAAPTAPAVAPGSYLVPPAPSPGMQRLATAMDGGLPQTPVQKVLSQGLPGPSVVAPYEVEKPAAAPAAAAPAALPTEPAAPASQRLGEITKIDPNSTKPEDIRWNTVMSDRIKELETLGVDTTKFKDDPKQKLTAEDQINAAWRTANEGISKLGLSVQDLQLATEERVAKKAAEKRIDPSTVPPQGRAEAYKEVRDEAVEKKATEFYGKYTWFNRPPPEEGKNTPPPTRREREWALFKEVKTNPRLNALDHINPDGSLNYDSAAKALSKDKQTVANDALNRDIKKDAANTARDVAGTEYTKALTASLKDPKSLTPAQKEALRSHADAAAEESALIRSKADKYREDFGELSDAEWDAYVREGDKTVAAILRNPALYDKFRADKTVHPLARTYINRELAVAKGTGLK